jgi:glycosyltransferase involved in cell wall biosynthesis
MPQRVLVVQEVLAQYRVVFFERLRDQLAEADVELILAHGSASGERAKRGDEARLPGAIALQNHRCGKIVWQPILKEASRADLVIVEHANRLLSNYALLILRRVGGPPVGFWGHGADLQAARRGCRTRLKRLSVRWPDWWFAYTEGSQRRVVMEGFKASRTTVVQNSADTSHYAVMRAHGVPREVRRCIYVGSLHRHKRLSFLMDVADICRAKDPKFELLVLGDGPLRSLIESRAARNCAIIYRGALFGEAKATAVLSSSLMLMPGLVGLAILDAFAAETPLVTTSVPYHSPEIEYLNPGRDGLILDATCDANSFADQVLALLADEERLRQLRQGCRDAAEVRTLPEMVRRFGDGILAALQAGKRQ